MNDVGPDREREREPDQDRLMDEAIDLMIRWQNDPGNPVAMEMARAWRARSAGHERMWARVERIHGASGRVMADRRTADRRRGNAGPSRRGFMVGGLAGLGAIGAGYAFLPDLLLRMKADVMTGKGEIRRVVLADGSVAILGPDSALASDMAGPRRRVELLAGMGFFDVVPDPARPFTVASGDMAATALGTAYEVSNDAGYVTVAVDHGAVDANSHGAEGARPVRLEAGDWVTFDPAARDFERGKREAGQVALWRDRLIIAEKETVSSLVARIGRWIPGRIVEMPPFVGAQRVSGIFDLKDPARALEAAVHPAGARVRRMSSLLTIISPL